jgi:hypothetical protein
MLSTPLLSRLLDALDGVAAAGGHILFVGCANLKRHRKILQDNIQGT